MARPPWALPPHHFPPALVQAVAQEAVCTADRVALFLDRLGLYPAGDGPTRAPRRLPGWFLLELGAALRLLLWEHNGIQLHLAAGLPSAQEALHGVFRRLTPAAPEGALGEDTPLSRGVLGLFVEHFAWSGRSELDADLLLGEADEDQLVDVLANLIWTHRAAVSRARASQRDPS